MNDPFLARLPMNHDLLEAITQAFRERSVRKAAFNAIGALSHCTIAYYDHIARQYRSHTFDGLTEIVSCMGNVSEKDGDIFVHAHIILAGEDFGCVGGHLAAGSSIFAAELYGMPVSGVVPVRAYDDPTGLALWAD
jgi:uncharacterized protein